MAKSKRQEMDLAMAEEFGLKLSPYVMVVKHVQLLRSQYGGFAFAYRHNGQVYYDRVSGVVQDKGVWTKPGRFPTPQAVLENLKAKRYSRWYYYNGEYLFPFQTCKYQQLLERFWIVDDPNPYFGPSVIVDPGQFNLRKRPLVEMRKPTVTWQDCTQLPTPDTKFTASERDVRIGPQPLLREYA